MERDLLPGYAAIFRHPNDELNFCTYVIPGGKAVPSDLKELHHGLLKKPDRSPPPRFGLHDRADEGCLVAAWRNSEELRRRNSLDHRRRGRPHRSWNHCTDCDMYRSKAFRVRALDETLEDIRAAGSSFGANVTKVFVADGDALVLDLAHWEAILDACRRAFPRMRRVSAYATAMNVNKKSPAELARLHELGLSFFLHGPGNRRRCDLQAHRQGIQFRGARGGGTART